MKISICCPSYKRSKKVETLDYITSCKVYVDCNEYDDYVKNNPSGIFVKCPEGVQGNLCRVRNYILDNEFANGIDAVLIIDDDMQGIYRNNVNGTFGYEKELIPEDELYMIVEKYSVLCNELGYKFWGVNCNGDALSYRHYSPFSFVSYIGGPFQCHLKNEIRYDENLPLKEDYDITLQHCNKYRGCLRVNFMYYMCKQSKQAGGCATYRNIQKEKEQFELLQKKWGNKIVKQDKMSVKKFDYNPIIKLPIKRNITKEGK